MSALLLEQVKKAVVKLAQKGLIFNYIFLGAVEELKKDIVDLRQQLEHRILHNKLMVKEATKVTDEQDVSLKSLDERYRVM
jgi:hypothetical protein